MFEEDKIRKQINVKESSVDHQEEDVNYLLR